MKRILLLLLVPPLWGAPSDEQDKFHRRPPLELLFSGYERPKNGPPLANIFHKARAAWIFNKLKDPQGHKNAKMPNLKLTEVEIRSVMAYLWSVRDLEFPAQTWPTWASKKLDDMNDTELAEMDQVVARGKAVFGQARCTICHAVRGPGGSTIGGFVELRVGGIDIMDVGNKLHRDWLYAWLKDPRAYFPETLMPRYRFTDEDARALVEFGLRDESTKPDEDAPEWVPEQRAFLSDPEMQKAGKELITKARCVVCHDIRGIDEVLSASPRPRIVSEADLKKLSSDTSCVSCHRFADLARDVKCLSCHEITGRGGWYAPSLTTEGSRLQGDWLRKFVREPDMVRPLSQQMPKFNLTDEEAQTIAKFVDEFLVSDKIPREFKPDDAERGKDLFYAKGCQACHTAPGRPGGLVGPSFANIGNRVQRSYILYHLQNPHATNPYTAEPDLGLTEAEARALATFLSSLKEDN